MHSKSPRFITLLLACALASAATLVAAQPRWISLFDGRSFKGWKQMQGEAKYEIRDGAIVGIVVEGVPANSFMVTEEQFGDFIFECEFKADPGINSGIQFRSAPPDGNERKRVYGYQFEIDPTPRALTGGLYEEGRRGWFQPPANKGEPKEAWNKKHGDKLKRGEWNKVRIEARGNRVKTWLNGYQLVDFVDQEEDVRLKRGFIGLQVHSTKNSELFGKTVAFRNLRIQKLD
jgi:hypothetical protein